MSDRSIEPEIADKARRIRAGALRRSDGDLEDAIRRLSLAIAYLTNPSKEKRDAAKRRVRQWTALP